jgi:hypothetical protein
MLCGMNLRNRTTAVGVGKIEKGVRGIVGAVAGREKAGDLAFVDIDGASIKVGGAAVGDGGKFEIIGAVFGAAAGVIAAVGDTGFVERGPGGTAVCARPDSLVVSLFPPSTYHVYISLRPGTTAISPR